MKRKKDNSTECGLMLLEIFQKLADKKKRDGHARTADNYQSAINKLEVYLSGHTASMILQEVTEEWVSALVCWLKEQHPGKPQTADFYFRNLRALYNRACEESKIGYPGGLNPFRKIVLMERTSAKRALTKEEADRLLVPAFRNGMEEQLGESLDVLLFILFMRGMVFQDVYNLTWKMADDDNHVHYLRNKTKMPMDTEISSEARTIMERYRQKDCSYVFPFLHHAKNMNTKDKENQTLSEQSALRRVNRHAFCIGKLAGLSIPLSTYVMRHTFATLMLEAGKPVELISQCLGHASIRTTEMYLSRISVGRVDKEVNDMLDRMLRPTVKNKKERKKREGGDKEWKTPPRKEISEGKVVTGEGELETPFTEKKYLFLHKKETYTLKAPFSVKFSLAKVHYLNNIANFYYSFFSSLVVSILFFLQKKIHSLKILSHNSLYYS